jgi:hypothetical protein
VQMGTLECSQVTGFCLFLFLDVFLPFTVEYFPLSSSASDPGSPKKADAGCRSRFCKEDEKI